MTKIMIFKCDLFLVGSVEFIRTTLFEILLLSMDVSLGP